MNRVKQSTLLALSIASMAVFPLSQTVSQAAEPSSQAAQRSDVRILAVSNIPPLDPWPEGEAFIAVSIASATASAEAGARGEVITAHWSELEPAPGQYQFDDLAGNARFHVETLDQVLFVGIQVINTTAKETPADLLDVAFDDPQMLTRFQALIDALAARLRAEGVADYVRYLSIGNEVDGYLAATDQWEAYTTFYAQAADYARAALPSAQVGVTVGSGGAQQFQTQVARLNDVSDVFILTYYPLNDDFTPRPPETASADIARMLELADEKPLLLQEVGYPAAEDLGSSEAAQAAFVREVFTAWDAAGERIPLLNWFALGDFTPQMCQDFTLYYQLPDVQPFYDYLCSLGLRRVDGTSRLAWDALVNEGQRRFGSHP